ncbi:hypothetical protein ACIQV2_02315 [Streptomyces globosus]|uniref:hypothetical protein n=1 Tax=Streptomyces globosus TaxID=68209 RepID=UPI003810D8C4
MAAALLAAGPAHARTLGLDQWWVDAVPEELRGRAMTLLGTGLTALQGIGMAPAGLAAEFLPVHQVVAGAGLLGTGVVLLLLAEVRASGAVRAPAAAEGDVRPRSETGPAAK